MKKINMKTKNIVKKILFFSLLTVATLAMSVPSLAACNGEPKKYRQFIRTYYEIEYPAILSFDSRCNYITNSDGQEVCRIRQRGTLYLPLASAYETGPDQTPAKFPALVINHGSEHTFEANDKFCTAANYFVPKGYIVFVPFRRGQGDNDGFADKSTGIYIEDMLDDWASASPDYFHDTQCSNRSCYKAQLLKEQADEDVGAAMEYLKTRTDVKTDPDDPQKFRIGIMGISYGGAVTVFANRRSLGQKAAVAFSPGAQQWGVAICAPFDQTCGTDFQRSLISAAGNADRPAYYLQAKWDYEPYCTAYQLNNPVASLTKLQQ